MNSFIDIFSFQEILDADDNPLKNKYGEKMDRDIVQFVPLRTFQSKTGANFSLVCLDSNLDREGETQGVNQQPMWDYQCEASYILKVGATKLLHQAGSSQ